ncbi:hypothetical protein SGRIM119S_08657 [Streptomyces griseorubiginosus]
MNPQNSSWTRSGVPRNSQMYAQLTLRATGLSDSRMSASAMPSTSPIAIATAVSSRVVSRPVITVRLNSQAPTVSQPKRRLVISDRSRLAASSTTTRVSTHWPGLRRR